MRSRALFAVVAALALVVTSGHAAVAQEPDVVTRPVAELFGRQSTYGYVGAGVQTATGNFTQHVADLDASTSLTSWTRTYNSLDSSEGALGRGWTPAMSSRVVPAEDGTVAFHDDDGRILTFAPDGAGGYARPQDIDADLSRDAGGLFTLRYFAGETWSFNAAGLLSERSREGQRLTLVRDDTGRLVSATHSAGHRLDFSYHDSGRLARVAASDGRSVSYGYSAAGLLTSFTAVDGAVTHYEYTGDGQLRRVEGPEGTQLGANAYDEAGRVRHQELTIGGSLDLAYDTTAGTTTVTESATDAESTYQHDEAGRPVKITDPAGNSSTRSYDAEGRLTSASSSGGTQFALKYDAHGNVTRYTAGGLTTAYTYDAADRLLTVTDPTEGLTRYEYTGDSRIPAVVTDPTGAVTRSTVQDGLVVETVDATGAKTTFGYDTGRRLTSVTDALGNISRSEYDAAGRRTASISPSGRTTRFALDAAGRVTAETTASGKETKYRYSTAGRLLEQTDPTGAVRSSAYNPAGQRTSSTDELGRVTRFEYDGQGKMATATDPAGDVSRYSYDQFGRKTTITYRDGAVTRFSYDAEGRVTERAEPAGTIVTSYDARGNVLTTTDAGGSVTRYEYDAGDRVIAVTDPTGAVWRTAYDGAGRITATIDPTGATTRYEYDAAGRLVVFTDPLGHKTQYRYDAAGRNTEIIDPMGGVTRYGYDEDGRRVSETSPAGLVTRYGYDADGRVTSVTDPRGGVSRFEYSARGEEIASITATGAVRRLRYDAAGQLAAAVDPNGAETTYAYDAAGRLTSLTDAKGAIVRYAYDVAGGTRSFTDALGRTTRRTFDKSGKVTAVTEPSGQTTRMEYNPAGDLLRRIGADGSTVSFGYDAAGRRTAMTDATGTTRYTHDPAGRLLTMTGPDNTTFTHRWDASSRLIEMQYPSGLKVGYQYDANNRLLGADDPKSGDARYTLDADGRLLAERLPSDWERRYHYDGGLLTRFEDLRNGKHARLTDFTYDADGQLKTQTEGNNAFAYRYDPAGQLVAVTNHDETVLQATYDPVGNRTSMQRDGVETRLTYDAADQLLTAVTGTDRVDYRYDTSGRMVEQSDAATRRTTSYNAFGLPDMVTFTDGKVTQTRQHTYDGDNLLGVLTSTSKQEDADTPRTRTMRYRWSRTDPVAQILQQREDPVGGRNATCPNNDDGPGTDGEYRADADFVYGHGRVFADSPCGSGTFARDAFGSAIQTGDTWRWAQSSEYDVFGVPKPNDAEGSGAGQPPLDPRFGYRGELASGGTVYLRARSYDATVGRFTARDPLATEAGQTDVVSPYAYANNSPLNFADPRGEFPMPDDVLNIIAGLVPSLAAGQPCPDVENTPNPARAKCFQGMQLMTRGGYEGKEWALNGAQAPLSEMWYARPSQGEKAAQAFAINELSERRDGFWAFWDLFDYGLNEKVDWEVGPKSGGYQQRSDGAWTWATKKFRIDIVTDETDIYEVKRWDNGKGKDIVTDQLAEYHTYETEWNVRWNDSIELRDWADGFEVTHSEGFLGLFNRKETDVLVWGPSDAGHLYFDEAELADEGARAKMKAKKGSGRNKGGYWRVPRRR